MGVALYFQCPYLTEWARYMNYEEILQTKRGKPMETVTIYKSFQEGSFLI